MRSTFSLLFWLSWSTILFGQKPWMTTYDQNSFGLDARKNVDTLDIPLKIDDGTPFKEVTIVDNKPVFVRLVNRYGHDYSLAIKIVKSEGTLPGIQITVDLRLLRDPGTYQVVVLFAAPSPHTQQEVSFSLIRPAARIDTASAIRIFIEDGSVRSNPFAVVETSNASSVQSLTLSSLVIPGLIGKDVITFSPVNRYLPAGDVVTLGYQFNDRYTSRLGYGKTTGKIQLNAPELTTPLIVPVEIVRKGRKVWIFIALFLGILTGFLLRHFLKDRKAAAEARLKELYDRAAAIQENVKFLFGYFESAVLSDVVRKVIQPAETAFKAARTALTAMDPDEAQKQLDIMIKTINGQLIAYKNNSKSLIIGLQVDDSAPVFLSPGVRQLIKENLLKIGLALDQVQTDKTDVKSLSDNLILTDTVQTNLGKTIEFLQKVTSDAAGAIWKDNGSAEMAQFRKTFDEWHVDLEKASIYPFKVPDAGLQANLKTAWTAVQNVQPAHGVLEGMGPFALPRSSFLGGILSWVEKNYFFNNALTGWVGAPPGAARRTYEQSTRRWILYGAIEVVLLTLLVGIAAYKFYAPDFIGTWDEITTIFFIGFGLDITVDNVAALKFKN